MIAKICFFVVISVAIQFVDGVVNGDKHFYDKVFRIYLNGSNSKQRTYLLSQLFGQMDCGCDVWRMTPDVDSRIDVRVNRAQLENFEQGFRKNHIKYETFLSYVGFACETPVLIEPNAIEHHFIALQKNYTEVKIQNFGKSSQGKPLQAVKVSFDNRNAKPTILVTGDFDPRSWQSTFVVMNLLDLILMNSKRDTPERGVLRQFDWIFIPNLNPDGYAYTVETDRLWEKNMRPWGNSGQCRGVDLGRNFPKIWQYYNTTCSVFGPSALSEPESKCFYKFLNQNKGKFIGAIVIMPYGHELYYPEQSMPSASIASKFGANMIKAMEQSILADLLYDSKYTLHVAQTDSGNIINALKDEYQVPYPFLLYTASNHNRAFCVQQSEATQARREAYEGVLALIKDISKTQEYANRR